MPDPTPAATAIERSRQRPFRAPLRRLRAWVEKHPVIRFAYRFLVGVLGGGIVILGLLLVPLPGPGWLVVFMGLGILGTEFPFAHRITSAVKRVLLRFWSWMQRRRAARQTRKVRVHILESRVPQSF